MPTQAYTTQALAKQAQLSHAQLRAITALQLRTTTRAAAALAGVKEAALKRWLREPVFLAALQEAQERIVGESVMQIRTATLQAVETLRRVMSDGNASAFAKVTAARTVLDYALHSARPLTGPRRERDKPSRAEEEDARVRQPTLTSGQES